MRKPHDFGFTEHELSLATLESVIRHSPKKQNLTIGIPKESISNENRVCLTPNGVSMLTKQGHTIYIEQNAGLASGFRDKEYLSVGARVINTTEEVYKKTNLIVKVSLPTEEEYSYLQSKQVLFSGIDVSMLRYSFIETLKKKNITALGYEFIETRDGELPILRTISELTGGLSIQIAAACLQTTRGGKGMMLGSVAGIPPSTVVIIGAGTVGQYATQAALGLGAHVIVIDKQLQRLRHFETIFNRRVVTAIANDYYILQASKIADVMIGAMNPRAKSIRPIVSEEAVKSMSEGSVIVDVSINQFRCFETSHKTSHKSPTFVKHGVIHYCVPNITSSVAYTSSYALNNILLPFINKLGQYLDTSAALWSSHSLYHGTYTHSGYVTKPAISLRFGLVNKNLRSILASEGNFHRLS